ncbi:wound-induced protein 1 [Punica granatum]|uniref:Uncharacterized protein n=2 Tax=Punica granatum TaxID=22663 RepID=A0A2I0HRT1_PUNGR|nr:wound-induced protein 1 [Punica granatum]PKI34425.1 hypothetical protein CRG98_045171 [Punica granatum]
MRLLTGSSSTESFEFVPDSITSFGSTILSEGCDPSRSISWVHAWTVSDGIITQVREYFNTSLTVTRFGEASKSSRSSSSPSEFAASSASSTAGIKSVASLRKCPSVWESSLSDRVGKSVPGLVLAI